MIATDRNRDLRSIVLYDGFCNLCSNAVLLFLKLDRKKKFKYIALQSDDGKEVLKRIQNSESGLDSVMLFKNDQVYYKSRAIFQIIRETGGITRLLLVFSIFPDKFNDYIYDLVARNRYLIFGKKKECFIIQ